MKRSRRLVRRSGFTLVELLIVIVVIGVLSAMMMLSSTEAVSSAKASNVVSNLRNLKTAALAYYADHLDDVAKSDFNLQTNRSEVLKYMNNGDVDENYKFAGSNAENTWYVYYVNSDTTTGAKLKSRQSSIGLRALTVTSDAVSTSADVAGTANENVGIFIR